MKIFDMLQQNAGHVARTASVPTSILMDGLVMN